MPDPAFEYIAILRRQNDISMEYLYVDADGTFTPESAEMALRPDVEQVLRIDGVVMSSSYQACKQLLEDGEIAVDDITDLLV